MTKLQTIYLQLVRQLLFRLGEKKYKKYGKTFITAIKDYCSKNSLDTDAYR